ncbi:hypothetical protein JCM10049v2_004826 [Rhodotorula toruloides]
MSGVLSPSPASAPHPIVAVSSGSDEANEGIAGLPNDSPPLPASLVTLPTELLSTILSLAMDLHLCSDRDRLQFGVVMLYKRVFEVAYPIWSRNLCIEALEDQGDTVFTALFSNPTRGTAVVHLAAQLSSCLPNLQCSMLRRMHALTYLCISWKEPPVPPGFSLERDVPSLRRLIALHDGNVTLAQVMPGLSLLTHLETQTFSFAGAAVPWRTLLYLDIDEESIEPDHDIWTFLQSLLDAYKTGPIALRRLRLRVPDDPHPRNLPASCWFLGVLTALTAANVAELAFVDLDYSIATAGEAHSFRLTTDVLKGLQTVLAFFPDLLLLRISGFPAPMRAGEELDAVSAQSAILEACGKGRLEPSFRTLGRLLRHLRGMPVLQVILELDTEGTKIRWRRQKRDEGFVAEGWTDI